MNEKEIIIDGVNVAGCNYLNIIPQGDGRVFKACNKRLKYSICSNNPDCYYKKLQRKGQECEKFRKANDEKNEFLQKLGISSTGEFHRIKHYIDKIIAENEELKQQKKLLYEKAIDKKSKLEWAYGKRKEKSDNYKKALKEIETLIKASVDPEQTPKMWDSLDALYEALDIAKEVLKNE